jgi:hypothetical protein
MKSTRSGGSHSVSFVDDVDRNGIIGFLHRWRSGSLERLVFWSGVHTTKPLNEVNRELEHN